MTPGTRRAFRIRAMSRAWLAVEPVAREARAVRAGRRAVHAVHVGRRPAQVVDEALEVGMLRQAPDLVEDGVLAPRDDAVALVEGEGAEGAAADAAPVGDDRELPHLELGVAVGDRPRERQAVDPVEVARLVLRRGILDDEAVGVSLGEEPPVGEEALGLAEEAGVARRRPRTTASTVAPAGGSRPHDARPRDAVQGLALVQPLGDLQRPGSRPARRRGCPPACRAGSSAGPRRPSNRSGRSGGARPRSRRGRWGRRGEAARSWLA